MVKYIQNYALHQSIGSGVYGKVYRAINNSDKKQYAIKVIPILKFRENKKLQQCTVNQINILTNIEVNQHIIKYYDMLKTSNNFYFIYEFCNGGTLESLLSKQGKLSEQSALLIFKQLLEAFQVLNKYNIMHRDLKPDNIFFHNGVIKLGDFGFCKNLNSADEMAKTMLGSPIYMAPEVLRGEIYSNKADIWSLGVVLYEMLFGHCPFQSNSIAKLIEVLNTKQLEFPGNVSSFLKDLIQKMLTKDSTKRVGWMELFQIKISNEGVIESQKIKAISSLSDAKYSEEAGLLQTKYSPTGFFSATVSQGSSGLTGNKSTYETSRDSISGQAIQNNSQQISNNNQQFSQSINQNSIQNSQQNNSSQSINQATFKKNRQPVSPNIQQIQTTTVNNISNGNNNPINNNNQHVINNNSSYMPSSSTQSNNMIGQMNNNTNGLNNTTANNLTTSNSSNKITQQHKSILQGIKITMQIIQSRIPNCSGYAHLVLSKNISTIQTLLQRPFRKQIVQILQKQLKDIKSQRQSITAKMFSYQLKGLDDWKKYLRGKFFQDEKTIVIWHKMIGFLSSNSVGSTMTNNTNGMNYAQMAENIKSILY